jgi:hypothetical protein
VIAIISVIASGNIITICIIFIRYPFLIAAQIIRYYHHCRVDAANFYIVTLYPVVLVKGVHFIAIYNVQ